MVATEVSRHMISLYLACRGNLRACVKICHIVSGTTDGGCTTACTSLLGVYYSLYVTVGGVLQPVRRSPLVTHTYDYDIN